ncbi:aryl-alcohol-oxidase from pleurotus Eryingii [Lactarius pseudohatsudake]|nr:aryl-alcohol-oxidase from pleurotus Eryingii [Lactarius pseudohatsudake]KAH9027159.1 aryl-alcohol-oxidase from pleurotus Eryingii [Lactarius pseudohatsudake]
MRLSVIALLFLKSVFAAVYTDPSKLPNSPYTYIIAGSGPGGSVLANRLSANPNDRVLLVEVGPSDTVNPNISIPFLCTTLVPSNVSWNQTTVPQTGLGGRSIPYPRGRTLGGSTSINYMIWTRGPASDFDRLAHVTGDSGWSWDSLRRTSLGVEDLVPPPDGHDTTGEINPAIHGSNGPVKISVQDTTALDSRIFNTTTQLAEFPLNEDMSSGNPLGIGWSQLSIGGGQRSSASVSYLTPVLSRSNLDILVNTLVTKVVQTGSRGGLPIFRGVQFAQSASGPLFSRNATKEVILAAGAVNTPQLLMLSGIGDSAQLSRFNIRTTVNLPDVGKNMQDHALIPNAFSVNSNSTNDDIGRNTTLFQNDLAQWEASHTGPFSQSIGIELGWLRLPKNSTIFKKVKDPSSGPQAPHYEFIFVNQFFSLADSTPTTGHFMSIFTNLVTPTSRGSITLASANAFDAPNIDPALLNSDFDIFTIREAVKAALRFVAAPAWKDYVIGPFGALAEAKTDEEIEAYARSHGANVFHPSSTAFMSRKGSARGVVNPDLSVKKTVGLRIVDASVLPWVPAAHPQAIIYIIAERAAKLIAADYD